ncbi:MAG: AAA family ATPase, partial [Chloroflexota bacterium]
MTLQHSVLAALEPYKLRQQGSNQYRCNSPLRKGSDSESFVVTLDDADGGKWYDHVDEVGGSLHQLAVELGLITERVPVESTKRAYKSIDDYAAAHGLTGPVLADYGWKEHEHKGRHCLAFKTDNGWRYRFLDGEKPYYLNQKGYTRCWYGLGGTWIGRVAEGAPVVLTNGEISTVAGHHYGLAAFCVTSGEKARVPDKLLTELGEWLVGFKDVEILVALDCDTKGRKAANGITEQMRGAGFNVRAADLGLGHGGDLADFCTLYGDDSADRLRALPDLVTETVSTLPNDALLPVKGVPRDKVIGVGQTWMVMHARDRHFIPPVEWIIPGEIPERGLTVIYGPSGVGKSFYIIDTALSIAQEHPVVYMALEGEGGVPSRIDAWCQHNRRGEGDLVLALGTVNFFEDADLDTFLGVIGTVQPKLVVVDTLARSMVGADENSTRDMTRFTAQCSRIMRTLNCAVVLVHHTGKQGDYERGSSVLRGAADSMIALIDDDEFIQVKCTKSSESKAFESQWVELLPGEGGQAEARG